MWLYGVNTNLQDAAVLFESLVRRRAAEVLDHRRNQLQLFKLHQHKEIWSHQSQGKTKHSDKDAPYLRETVGVFLAVFLPRGALAVGFQNFLKLCEQQYRQVTRCPLGCISIRKMELVQGSKHGGQKKQPNTSTLMDRHVTALLMASDFGSPAAYSKSVFSSVLLLTL